LITSDFLDAIIRSQSVLLPLAIGLALLPVAFWGVPKLYQKLSQLVLREIYARQLPELANRHIGLVRGGPQIERETISSVEAERPWLVRFYRLAAGLTLTKIAALVLLLAGLWAAASYFFGAKYIDPAIGLPLPRQRCTERPEARAAIIFIHGWNGAADATWENFPRLACEDPRLGWAQIYVVNYPTFMVRRSLSVSELADWLHDRFFSITIKPRFSDVYILAHSMGGLVGRRLYMLDRNADRSSSIRALITIASPYQGASIGPLASALGISQRLTSDMDPQSSFLNQLDSDWRRLPHQARPATYCFTSPLDSIVTTWSATNLCECAHKYPQWGHIDMVKPSAADDERYDEPVRALQLAYDVRLQSSPNRNCH
jgi:pimeloyl-ACP methyl ester carboxylesterase